MLRCGSSYSRNKKDLPHRIMPMDERKMNAEKRAKDGRIPIDW